MKTSAITKALKNPSLQDESMSELEAEIERLLYVNYTDAVSDVSRKEKGLASANRYKEKRYAEWAKYKKEAGI
jgi:hypothetical protein